MKTETLPANLRSVSLFPARTITCRVHLLPCQSNDRGILLCPDCLSDLDEAAEFVADLRASAETTFENALTLFEATIAQQDEKTIAWWQTMSLLNHTEPARFDALCKKALEANGRGAVIVRARTALDEAARILEEMNSRCEKAMVEIESARGE